MCSSFMNQVIEAGSVKDALTFILFSSVKTVLDANIEASKSNSSFALDSQLKKNTNMFLKGNFCKNGNTFDFILMLLLSFVVC
eukprot:UN02672